MNIFSGENSFHGRGNSNILKCVNYIECVYSLIEKIILSSLDRPSTLVSGVHNTSIALSKTVKFLNIHSISYHLKVLEFGLWPCGLCRLISKFWYFW